MVKQNILIIIMNLILTIFSNKDFKKQIINMNYFFQINKQDYILIQIYYNKKYLKMIYNLQDKKLRI